MPWGAIAGALISTLGSMANQQKATQTASVNNYESYYYTKKLTDYNNQLARENYDYEFAKESPAARVQQYRQAGLHTGLMHSNGFAGMQGTVSSSPSGTITPSQAGFYPMDTSALSLLASNLANIEKTKSETKLNEEKALTEEKQRENISADTEYKKVQKDLAEYDKQLKLSTTQLNRVKAKESESVQKLNEERMNSERAKQILDKASAEELVKRAGKYASEIGLNEEQAKHFKELARKVREDADYRQWVNEAIEDTGFDPSQGGIAGAAERSVVKGQRMAKAVRGFILDLLAHPPADINFGN